MANPAIAELISRHLREGLVHPGDPARDLKPQQIALPFGFKAGMGEEMSKLMDVTVTMLGEAIVALIEGEGGSEIVLRDEVGAMRLAVGDVPPDRRIPIYCRCDSQRQRPLAVLSMTTPDRIVLDGRALMRGLAKLSPDHPHDAVPS